MIRSPKFLLAAGAVALLGAATLPSVTASAVPVRSAATATHPTTPAQHKVSKKTMKFSHETVVDEQRSGFEPDILTDSKDHMYTSVPNGSSQGTSFVWSSRDHGKSFQLVPGNVLQGKPATCNGGGDTELQLDKGNNLFLSDLQNLTNLSNSVTHNGGRTWDTTCVGADNTPVDRMWYAVQGTIGTPGFAIYEEYDAVESSTDPKTAGGNQLVEEVSSNGTTFVPVVNPDFTHGCLGGGAYNCVSDDEGISGNQLVMPDGEVVIAHSSADGNGVVVSYSTPKLTRVAGRITAATATWHSVTVNKAICPDKAGASPGICGSSQFATVAQDSAGDLYVSFSSAQRNAAGSQTGPYNVYVARSTNHGRTWGAPIRVSHTGSNSFSWITAGSKGRVAMAWYHANEARGPHGYTFDDLTTAEFSVQESMSINALSKHPKYALKTVSEHPIKYGPICTLGLDCTVSGGDRSLGDFLEVSKDRRGALDFSYVDDTSNTYTTGATGFAENGPPVVVRQIHGPSLIKGKANPSGYISSKGRGPGAATNSIKDGRHEDNYSANEAHTYAGTNLDLRGAKVLESHNRKSLIFTMKLASLKSLAVSATAGGPTGEWITRFTTYDPRTLGNGHIYYVGMESVAGGTPTFYDGDTSAPTQGVQLSMNFTASHAVPGKVKTKQGVIRIKAPVTDFPGLSVKHPRMYSTTAFTGTTAATLTVPDPTGIQGEINQTDATAPFDVRVHLKPRRSAAPPKASLFTTIAGGTLGGLGLLALGVGGVWLWRRRHAAADNLITG